MTVKPAAGSWPTPGDASLLRGSAVAPAPRSTDLDTVGASPEIRLSGG
jgi:hypothetical protein